MLLLEGVRAVEKTVNDDGLSLDPFKGSDDATKLRAFEMKNKTKRQEYWHVTVRIMIWAVVLPAGSAGAIVMSLLSKWL